MKAEPITSDDGYLIVDLSTDPAFATAVKDDEFAAVAFVDIAFRLDWINEDDRKTFIGGNGKTANLIALLRNQGENSLDIEIAMTDRHFDIPMSEIEIPRSKLEAILREHGWRPA